MPSPSEAKPAGGRVLSIDALRGFDMFCIIGGVELLRQIVLLFVNPLPGAVGNQLHHAAWEGFTAWDLIMPLFLFIVGAAMPFSFAKRVESGQSKKAIYRKVISRVIILWVLGMIAQGNLLAFDLSKLQVFTNTLQCIAVGYLVAAILLLHVPRWGQALVTIALLAGYWALMKLVPFGDHPAGTIEEGVNLAHYIDPMILGRFIYSDRAYAWILPCMTYAANVLLGVFAGHVLRAERSHRWRLSWLVALGLGCLALGWTIAGGPVAAMKDWGIETPPWAVGMCDWLWRNRFPIIKHIVSTSMVLWAAGWCYLLLALFYLVIDVLQFRAWSFPFVVIGSNAILAYMLTHPAAYYVRMVDAYIDGLSHLVGQYSGLLHSVAAFGTLWLLLYILYRNKTFLRV